QIDLDAHNKNSNSFKICVANTKDLFQFMRNLHQGPLVGEGGIGWGRFDTFYAGYIDGVDRLPERRNNAFITPEHELLVIKPYQVNYGMGQFERYFDYGENTSFAYYDLDLYRASEIVFGHAGYFNYKNTNTITHNLIFLKFAREYYLMQQLQKRYLPRDVVPIEILYYDQEQWISQDELILKGRDLEDVLLKIVYSNGLNIWINHKDDDFIWEADIYNGISLSIPPNGFVALKTTGEIFLACSIQVNDDRMDYVLSDEYIFAENRSHVSSNIGYLSTNGMATIQKNSFDFFDIHLLEGDYIFNNMTNRAIIGTSTRCHLNIIYNNEKEFLLVAPFIFKAQTLSINLYNIHPNWLSENGKLPSDINRHIKVFLVEGDEEKPADDISIYSSGTDLSICNIKAWKTYLFRFRE
ncbi:hypothetical protein KKB18_03075, partial [bacterium]|nr:hypothetical protein [bacterium]